MAAYVREVVSGWKGTDDRIVESGVPPRNASTPTRTPTWWRGGPQASAPGVEEEERARLRRLLSRVSCGWLRTRSTTRMQPSTECPRNNGAKQTNHTGDRARCVTMVTFSHSDIRISG